jgi:hypothetical protein
LVSQIRFELMLCCAPNAVPYQARRLGVRDTFTFHSIDLVNFLFVAVRISIQRDGIFMVCLLERNVF